MKNIRAKRAFICDMDGVLYHGNRLLDGTRDFIDWLKAANKKFLFLTNSSERSPRELKEKLARLGIQVDESVFYTSALATAIFLKSQRPGGSAYVIGEAGLINALYDAGFSMNDVNPDYVIVGETRGYSFDKIQQAVNLVLNGAMLIGTNPDVVGNAEHGMIPACRALTAPVELATRTQAYYVGKPNPLMMRHALKKLGCKREETVIVGDRMDTDIIAGIESEIDTVLVLSGVTAEKDLNSFSYRPRYVARSVAELVP
ncbi:MAG: HAD-IIA family hydrolase [Chitinivibrionales bacterium]|nr:HAD-IIA family hydrolase [Chitinivibrionales bacterium]MBD3395403.1 HAD-IIA family hydrolase [Chitinivibrionales bacterium]